MRKSLFLFAMVFLFVSGVEAQIEVPVVYDLGVKGGERMVGFLTGGSIFEEEGLRVTQQNATEQVLLKFIHIDEIASLSLKADGILTMQVVMKGGEKFPAECKVIGSEPLIILRDEVASGSTQEMGKERIFKRENFRGIPLIEFEAALPVEECLTAMSDLAKKFKEAVDLKDVDRAIELHNQIGELLESVQGSRGQEEDDDPDETPKEEPQDPKK